MVGKKGNFSISK